MAKRITREAKKYKNLWKAIGVILLISLSFTACSAISENGLLEDKVIVDTLSEESTTVRNYPDQYDSADTPILVDKSEKDKTLTFLNLQVGKRYTLSFDGTTRFYDKYGESVSLEQIRKGDIVDVTFFKSDKHLVSMRLSEEAWTYSNVERYEFNHVKKEVIIGSEVYKITDNTQYVSDGRSIEEIDLNAADVLSFQGIGTQVLSVNVEKGHGYLRLVNDEKFVGGWIEIGQTQIQRITEDMLVVVPEGSYQVNISHNGGGGIKNIVINRNEETTLDIGDLEVPEAQFGTVVFSVTPSTADIYIDGTLTDVSLPVSLEYGIHQLIAKADGYKSLTQYLRVGEASAGIDVVLDEVEDTEEENESTEESTESTESAEGSTQNTGESTESAEGSTQNAGESTESAEESTENTGESTQNPESSSSSVDVTTSYYKVYIDAPENVEVYLDGNYIGVSPCSFKKTSGSHVITLRKSGYETRSYTIQVDEEEKDISYSFVDLISGEMKENLEDTRVNEQGLGSTISGTE